ncbi:MAG TPA: peptidase domain-containing ABC transporter [Blastocatellia bacterium]|nr:peptidase domain-containing ABC transporter [Blastocatellia bacterium]
MFGINRFPVSYQLDAMDCGPSCLQMIARYHGKSYPKHLISRLCEQDRQGASIATLARGAEKLGFRTLAVKVSFDELRDKAPLPCIAYWPQGHFVVIRRVRKDRVDIADPSAGLTSYSRSEFETCWLTDVAHADWGILLLLEPTKQLLSNDLKEARSGATNELWRPLWRDTRRHMLPIAIAIIVSLFAQLLLPFLSGAVVDVGIANRSLNLVYIVLLAELVLLVSRLSVDLLQAWLLTYVGLKMDMRLAAQFLMKLTRLPLAFFDGKLIGDLLQRIGDLKSLQVFLTNSLWQVILSGLSLVVFGTVLALFSPKLFFVFGIGSVLYLGYCALFVKRQRLLSHKNFRLSAQKQGLIIEFLSGMQEIKLNNAEEQRRWQWEAAQHAIAKVEVKAQLLSHYQVTGGAAINEIKNLVLTLLVASSVIDGTMTLGMMVAVQFVIGQLSWPLNQITMMMYQSHEAVLSYQRAAEIHQMEDESSATAEASPERSADIVFKNVEFGYGGTTNNRLFRDLNLTIPRGKTTAIVGRSGSGKTTLMKLILQFYRADAGEIMAGGTNINDLSHRQWREMCGIVMQDGYIFSDTIVNNIAVAEDLVDMARVAKVASVAQIDGFINSLPLGYDTRVGRDGVGISRGQAQRILIARALYKDPSYLFFDEATSALDAETESLIVDQLRGIMLGKTAVVIAHRMSTVRHADQIIVLDHGEALEIGTHEELVRNRGEYFELVRNQLDLGD